MAKPTWLLLGGDDRRELYVLRSYKRLEVDALKDFVMYYNIVEDEEELDGLSYDELWDMLEEENTGDIDRIYAIMKADGTVVRSVNPEFGWFNPRRDVIDL